MALFRPYQQSTPEQRAEKKAAAAKLAAEQEARQDRLADQQQAVAQETQVRTKKSRANTDTGAVQTIEQPAEQPVTERPAKAAKAATVAVQPEPDAPTVAAAAPSETSTTQPVERRGYTPKKDRPTPTRAESEAARINRINPKLTPKEQRAADRAARREKNAESYAKAEEEPTRVLLRDYIDSRWSLNEFIFPIMLVLFALVMGLSTTPIAQYASLAVMVLFVGWIGNTWWMWRGFKAEAKQRLKNPQFRGLLMYGNARMMNIRRFRRPAPRINRGDDY